jgi:uncharacterized protein (TIGR00255 family)
VPDARAMASIKAAGALVQREFPDARPALGGRGPPLAGRARRRRALSREDEGDLLALVKEAVRELNQTRQREGAKLETILRDRLERVGELVKEAQPLMPAAIKAFQEKLAAKLAEAGASASDERVHQEVVLYAARIDVDEELTRLVTHVAEMKRVLDKGGACGKRLDFLCQEFNREANTLGSKSVANEITRISVEMKVLIEQMREQVQNIE